MNDSRTSQSVRSKSELRVAVHELNEVFTVIAHYADACGQIAQPRVHSRDEQLRQWSARIIEQVQRGTEIAKQLVDENDG